MSQYVHKSHNVSVIMHHFVCPTKYRKVVFSEEVDTTLKDICMEISNRYGKDSILKNSLKVMVVLMNDEE